mmetsp:Transcript_113039/g.365030  ORF Transcript_113039/g.365030 Transcript_113039/m.365030 type:complete len:263 (+) Transcript_113039:1984-2772(+)
MHGLGRPAEAMRAGGPGGPRAAHGGRGPRPGRSLGGRALHPRSLVGRGCRALRGPGRGLVGGAGRPRAGRGRAAEAAGPSRSALPPGRHLGQLAGAGARLRLRRGAGTRGRGLLGSGGRRGAPRRRRPEPPGRHAAVASEPQRHGAAAGRQGGQEGQGQVDVRRCLGRDPVGPEPLEQADAGRRAAAGARGPPGEASQAARAHPDRGREPQVQGHGCGPRTPRPEGGPLSRPARENSRGGRRGPGGRGFSSPWAPQRARTRG